MKCESHTLWAFLAVEGHQGNLAMGITEFVVTLRAFDSLKNIKAA